MLWLSVAVLNVIQGLRLRTHHVIMSSCEQKDQSDVLIMIFSFSFCIMGLMPGSSSCSKYCEQLKFL